MLIRPQLFPDFYPIYTNSSCTHTRSFCWNPPMNPRRFDNKTIKKCERVCKQWQWKWIENVCKVSEVLLTIDQKISFVAPNGGKKLLHLKKRNVSYSRDFLTTSSCCKIIIFILSYAVMSSRVMIFEVKNFTAL